MTAVETFTSVKWKHLSGFDCVSESIRKLIGCLPVEPTGYDIDFIASFDSDANTVKLICTDLTFVVYDLTTLNGYDQDLTELTQIRLDTPIAMATLQDIFYVPIEPRVGGEQFFYDTLVGVHNYGITDEICLRFMAYISGQDLKAVKKVAINEKVQARMEEFKLVLDRIEWF